MEKNKDEKLEHKAFKIAGFFDRLFYSMFRGYTSIFSGIYVDRVKNIELAIKVLIAMNIFFMFLTYTLVSAVIESGKEKEINISVTDEISTGVYTVRKNSASDAYFNNTARGFVSSVANYTYLDAEEKINSLLPTILPITYAATFARIKENVQFIVDEKVSQSFIIQKAEITNKGSRAKIVFSGLLTRKVGSITTIDNRPYEVPVIVKVINYTPYIESFDFNYVGIMKKDNDTEIALEREKEIALKKQKELDRKENSRSEYEERQKKLKNKDNF